MSHTHQIWMCLRGILNGFVDSESSGIQIPGWPPGQFYTNEYGLLVGADGSEVVITENHGHRISISAADIAAGVDKTYNIIGDSLHSHLVTITAADFAYFAAQYDGHSRVRIDSRAAALRNPTVIETSTAG